MQPDTLRQPRKQVVYNPADRDWTALYEGRPIGVFARPSAARDALDAHADALACHGALAADTTPQHPATLVAAPSQTDLHDPLIPYTTGGPQLGQPVTDAALDAALAHFCSVYDQPALRERAARAHSLLQDRGRWEVREGGAVQIVGKGATYIVTDAICHTLAGHECPDQKFRTGVTGGQCYHTIARELLRLAQILAARETASLSAPPAPDPTSASLAFVSLRGRLLGLALDIVVLADQPLSACVQAPQLILSAGEPTLVHQIRLQCQDGAGEAALRIAPADVQALWAAFRPLAVQLQSLQLFVDAADEQLVLSAGSFCASAPGARLTVDDREEV